MLNRAVFSLKKLITCGKSRITPVKIIFFSVYIPFYWENNIFENF